MENQGVFITLEGVHGCGKSTVAVNLKEKLERLGFPTVISVDQRGTALGRELRKINLESRDFSISPIAEALIIGAARHQYGTGNCTGTNCPQRDASH